MNLLRRLSLGGCLAAAICAASAGGAAGQGTDLKPFRIPFEPPVGAQLNRMTDLRTGRVAVKGPDLRANQEFLRQYAKGLVFPVTVDTYYMLPEGGELKPRTAQQNFDSVLAELRSQLLIPRPDSDLARLQLIQGDYVTEFGAALDEALAAVFNKPGLPPVMRVNAGRLLAEASRSGAPVHGKMIEAMLTNTYFKVNGKAVETPPEVLLYAMRAAGNLLAAYDLALQNSPAAANHTLPVDDLIKLVTTLEGLVVNGPPVADKTAPVTTDSSGTPITLPDPSAPPPPAGAPALPAAPAAKGLTPEQVRVVRYFRREAIRALAQVRFDTVGGRGGSADARPAYTLARVAANDVALSLPATAQDAAEAVVGLAGMAPGPNLALSEYAAAIAVGIRSFAGPRLASDEDKSLPWKMIAARLGAALQTLKANAQTTPKLRTYLAPLTALVDVAAADIVRPLSADAAGGVVRPTIDRLDNWIANNTPTDPARSLYTDSPKYKLTPRPLGQ